MLISVVVPIYNIERELERCILSIINQTYTDLEIILVNDGSTDKSLEICKKYAKLDKRIIIIEKENSGEYSARCGGVLAAKGEYIGHIDGDDWIEAEYFESLFEATQDGKVDVVISGLIEHRKEKIYKLKNGIPSGLYNKKDIEDKIYPVMLENNKEGSSNIFPSLCSKLFRRVLNVNNQIMTKKIKYDTDVLNTYQILLDADTICVTEDCKYHYIRRSGSLTNGGISYDQKAEAVRLVDELLYKKFVRNKQRKELLIQLKRYTTHRFYDVFKEWFQIHLKQYIFPYEIIEKGSKVILYGTGEIGRSFYMQLDKNKYAEVVLWVDRNYEKTDVRYADVSSPEKIMQCHNYDYIVVCVKNLKVAEEIIRRLKENLVVSDKIIWKSDYVMEADCVWNAEK